MKRPGAEFLLKALADPAWDFGNKVLYDMCSSNPNHTRDEVIIAKVWLIGRAYAAAIERRPKTHGLAGDGFYENEVAPKIRNSDIDKWFQKIREGSAEDIALHMEMHARVMHLFSVISGIEKRSLASKYLHFHFPDRFYIYDSRAQAVITKLTKALRKRLTGLREYDPEYAHFCFRARDLHREFALLLKQPLSVRAFDKALLACSRAATVTTIPDKTG